MKRVVLDTNCVISALAFEHGQLAWLITAWREGSIQPLLSRDTSDELVRVLFAKKERLQLSDGDARTLAGEYIPFCQTVVVNETCAEICRDPSDQKFLDLAHCGNAEVLVSGDKDLTAMAGVTRFLIQTPAEFRHYFETSLLP